MAIVEPDFDMAAADRPPQQFYDIATQQGQIWKAPVILTSRSDSVEVKVNSIALAAVVAAERT